MHPKDFCRLKAFLKSGSTLDVKYRQTQLSQLLKYLNDHRHGLVDAMSKDFMIVPGAEIEVIQATQKVEYALRNLDGWMKGESVGTGWSLVHLFDNASIQYDPKGVVLILASWNAPVALSIEPLIGAIAAGCCSVLKPSEISVHTSEFLAQTLPLYLDPESFAIETGGPEEAAQLIADHQWDMIFFTGSEAIGRLVYQEAAQKLIPVVLEMGGKSPAIVLEDCQASLQLAADRVFWGKMCKAGQLCIAPDYVLCQESIYDQFIGCLITSVRKMFGESRDDIDQIINEKHWLRLDNLVRTSGGNILFEDSRDLATRYFGPVIIGEPDLKSPVMAEEIFGPILPVLKVKDVSEAVEFVNNRPVPLITYLFTRSKVSLRKVKTECRAGNFCVNDTVLSYLMDELPFGGTGTSGIGQYHGRASFLAFSHPKACLERGLSLGWVDEATRFPPYSPKKLARLTSLMYGAPKVFRGLVWIAAFALILTGIVLALYYKWW